MPPHDPPELVVSAELDLLVPRNAHGTLAEGVVDVLTGIDGVLEVDEPTITGVVPRLNDLQVAVTARPTLSVGRCDDPEAAASDLLAAGFGVQRVDVERTGERTRRRVRQ